MVLLDRFPLLFLSFSAVSAYTVTWTTKDRIVINDITINNPPASCNPIPFGPENERPSKLYVSTSNTIKKKSPSAFAFYNNPDCSYSDDSTDQLIGIALFYNVPSIDDLQVLEMSKLNIDEVPQDNSLSWKEIQPESPEWSILPTDITAGDIYVAPSGPLIKHDIALYRVIGILGKSSEMIRLDPFVNKVATTVYSPTNRYGESDQNFVKDSSEEDSSNNSDEASEFGKAIAEGLQHAGEAKWQKQFSPGEASSPEVLRADQVLEAPSQQSEPPAAIQNQDTQEHQEPQNVATPSPTDSSLGIILLDLLLGLLQ